MLQDRFFGGARRLRALFAAALAAALVLPAMARADSAATIDANTHQALLKLRAYAAGVDRLLQRAAGVLVFPDIVPMAFGEGGQFGEGALLVDDETVAYYATAGSSFGLQADQGAKSEVVLFMTEQALRDFRGSLGWKVGVDGAVALATLGDGGRIDADAARTPVVGFIFSDTGLLYNLSLEGSKITRIAR
ncbi:MAG: hypothetical protein KDI01_08825 [Halioglobus sp.]|nr:hypothetical protein [Halioglobus sp.]